MAQTTCDESTSARRGALAAKIARNTTPGCRSKEDVLNLTRAMQSHGCFFASFSMDVLKDVCQNLEYRHMTAKKHIFIEGASATDVFMLATGQVCLSAMTSSGLNGGEDGGEIAQEVESCASKANLHTSRRAMKRSHAQPASTQKIEAEHEEVQEVVSAPTVVQRVRKVVSKLRKSSIANLVLDSKNRQKIIEAEKHKPSWVSTPEPGSLVVPMSGTGRLGVPVTAVLQELSKRSPAAARKKNQEYFNCGFQRFNNSVDAKVQRLLSVEPCERSGSKQSVRGSLASDRAAVVSTISNPATPELRAVEACEEAAGPSLNFIEQQLMSAAAITATIRAGHTFGVNACISGTPHDSTALSLEDCELLTLSKQRFLFVIDMERQVRRTARQQTLLSVVPSLQGLDVDKMQRLIECFRSSTHRRGAVLCWEGEVREINDETDRVQFIVKGCAHTYKSRSESLILPPTPGASAPRRDHSPLQRDVGALLPGQVINGSSQLLGVPEPLTVIVDSAEALVLSIAHAELVRLGGAQVVERVRMAVQELHTWRQQRLGKQEIVLPGPNDERDVPASIDIDNWDRLSTWVAESRFQDKPLVRSTSPPAGGTHLEHDGFSRDEALRGGPDYVGKPTYPVHPPLCGPALAESLMSLVRSNQPGPDEDLRRGKTAGLSSTASTAAVMAALGSHDVRMAALGKSDGKPDTRMPSPSTADIMAALGSHGLEENTFLVENHLPDDHFDCAPRLANLVSQLSLGEQAMRFPVFPQCHRLEMRGAQGIIMEGGPIDPIHIAALRSKKRDDAASASRTATAPAKFARSLPAVLPYSLPIKPSTAPLPQLVAPLTPLMPNVPPPRRWKRGNVSAKSIAISARSASASQGSLGQCSPQGSDLDVFDCPLVDSIELERNALNLAFFDETQSVGLHGNVGNSGREVSLTPKEPLSPTSPGSQRRRQEASGIEDWQIVGNRRESFLEMDSWQSERSMQSVGADASDPLAAGFSMANLSTMVDENSVWDQMWSVIGSGPSDSIFISENSQEMTHGWVLEAENKRFTRPWHLSTRPISKSYGKPGSSGQALMRPGPSRNLEPNGGALPYAHRPLRPKALESFAKKALREMSPLHVSGIDRFLLKPPSSRHGLRRPSTQG